jgi:hypothetical protein
LNQKASISQLNQKASISQLNQKASIAQLNQKASISQLNSKSANILYTLYVKASSLERNHDFNNEKQTFYFTVPPKWRFMKICGINPRFTIDLFRGDPNKINDYSIHYDKKVGSMSNVFVLSDQVHFWTFWNQKIPNYSSHLYCYYEK